MSVSLASLIVLLVASMVEHPCSASGFNDSGVGLCDEVSVLVLKDVSQINTNCVDQHAVPPAVEVYDLRCRL